MAGMKEIRSHMKSIRDTQKVTNAMYLIASAKMRKAKETLDQTRPFFQAVSTEIKRIFRTCDVSADGMVYFYPHEDDHDLPGDYAVLAVTSDKGLAGAYNHNVIRKTADLISTHHGYRLFVVGDYGRHYFQTHGFRVEQSFLASAKDPTMDRAREIATVLLDLFRGGEVRKIFVVYTDFRNGLEENTVVSRLLPFHQNQFFGDETLPDEPFEFVPDVTRVLDGIVPSYVAGFLYSALVDSFCCEQSARMTAMESASRNAQDLLDRQRTAYNHARQSRITREMIEISSAAADIRRRNQEKGVSDGEKQ